MIRDKAIMWVGAIIITILIPYGITMILTGVIGRNQMIEDFDSQVVIQLSEGENQTIIDLEDYIIGVLAAQIPIDYEMETIKAQAVIARTNVLRSMELEKTQQQSDLPFVYISKEQMLQNWGEKNYSKNYNRLRLAVSQTQGEVMKSEDEYIDALYHSVSVGTTLSASEMYGKEIPYLVSADSGHDVESPDYMTIAEFSYSEIQNRLKEHNIEVSLETLSSNLAIEEKTELGYVKKIKIEDEVMDGEKWKEIFELNSTNFYLEDFQGNLRMICLGKGHGLGFSQYGANEMAKQKESYEDLLKYYYKGINMYNVTKSGNDITRGDENETK